MTPLEGPAIHAPLKNGLKPPFLNVSEVKKPETSPLFTNVEILTVQDTAARVSQLAEQANTEIAALAEKALPIQTELANAELLYLNEANSKDLANAKTAEEIATAKAKHAEYARIYEEEATGEVSLAQINEMTKEANLPVLDAQPTLHVRQDIAKEVEAVGFQKSEAAQRYLLDELKKELDLLSKDMGRRDIIARDLQDTMKNLTSAYPHLTGSGKPEDIHLALRTKMLYSVLQDRKSDHLTTGNHGGPHVLDWDTRVAVDIGRDMGMTPEEELLLRFAVNFHDIGYTLPSVDRNLHDKNYWIDRRHEVQGAKVMRALGEKGIFRGLFTDSYSLSTMHDTILNHAKIDKLDLRDPNVRIRNALIAADITSVYDRKVPYSFEVAPDIMLGATFKIKVAKENIKDPTQLAAALEKIKSEAALKARNDKELSTSEYALECVLDSITQLSEATPDVLPGRLGYLEDMGHCGFDPQGGKEKNGEIYFIFTEAGHEDIFGRPLLKALFGRKVEGQKQKSAGELEAVEDQQQAGIFLSKRGIRIEFRPGKPDATLPKAQERTKAVLNTLFSLNRDYMTINNMLSMLINPKNPDGLSHTLKDETGKGNLLYQQLLVVAGSSLYRNGTILDRQELIAELQTDTGKENLVKSLYAKRGKTAERILNNPKI